MTSTWALSSMGVRPWLFLCAAIVGAIATTGLARSTPEAFSFGDVAVIEIAVGTTLRDAVALGPYSQFGWHHPGPMMFYLLAPFYALAGSNSIGLAVGALVLNVGAITTVGWMLAKHCGAVVAGTVTLVLSAYLLRCGDLSTSVWNPHLIVLPLIAAIVFWAAAGAGSGASAVGAAAFVSFVAQSSVSVVPVAAAIVGGGLALSFWVGSSTTNAAEGRPARWAWRALLVGLVLWLPPLLEQMNGRPGNLSKLLDFFIASPSGGQDWPEAVWAWGDVTTAAARPGFTLPWGQTYERRGSWPTTMLALGQLAALLSVAVLTWRRGQILFARLCVLTALASGVAAWSITRITGTIGDYQIFWLSAVGALNLALVAAAAFRRLSIAPQLVRQVGWGAGVLITISLSAAAFGALTRARQYGSGQRAMQAPRLVVSNATVEYLERHNVARPLFKLNSTSWLQAAGVVLHAYRRHGELAVSPEWVGVFGEALAPNGSEDVALEIGGGCPPGRFIVASADGLCVYRSE